MIFVDTTSGRDEVDMNTIAQSMLWDTARTFHVKKPLFELLLGS